MKRTYFAPIALALLVAGGITTTVDAATSRTWQQRERKDFVEAQLDGVSLSEDGSLRLAAGVTAAFEVPQPNLWCLAVDSKGRIYAGGGNEGRVYRILQGGEPEIVFDTDQIGIHALAIDDRDRVYAASSPNGAIWRLEEGREPVLVHDPEAVYIWGLSVDGNRLHAALGSPGSVIRIDTENPENVVTALHVGEDHIRTIARAGDGTIYAGSDPGGIVYRIAPTGESSVVYDSPMREVVSLVIDGSGDMPRIHAAALGPIPQRGRQQDTAGAQGGDGVTRVRVTADDGDEDDGQGQQPQQQQESRRPPVQERYYGTIYSIDSNGYARQVWESRERLPLSLALLEDRGGEAPSGLLVGTADEGDVILLGSSAAETSAFVTIPSRQVNALLIEPDGAILAAASNLGRVVRVRPGGLKTGGLTSTVHDAGFTSSWGTAAWSADVPRGASVKLQVRTGDTERPDDTWSSWSKDLDTAEGSPIPSPRARFIQWRVVMTASPAGETPVVRSVRVGYLQDNMPPEITSVEVQPPGLVLSGTGGNPGDASNGISVRRQPQQPRRSFEKGMRSVTWTSQDANDDQLRYDVEFKAEDETLWKPLVKDLAVEFHTWDETSLPDGVYRIRIRASDAASNPREGGRSAERVSPAFEVDNTPPVVGSPRFRTTGAGSRGGGAAGEMEVRVSDTFSPIADAAWSLDAGAWVPIHPVDGIADSRDESFRFTVEGLAAGEHTVTVRASDRAGNTGASRVVIRID